MTDCLDSVVLKTIDEKFDNFLFHTEIRWLSKSACLDRYYKLFDSVL